MTPWARKPRCAGRGCHRAPEDDGAWEEEDEDEAAGFADGALAVDFERFLDASSASSSSWVIATPSSSIS